MFSTWAVKCFAHESTIKLFHFLTRQIINFTKYVRWISRPTHKPQFLEFPLITKLYQIVRLYKISSFSLESADSKAQIWLVWRHHIVTRVQPLNTPGLTNDISDQNFISYRNPDVLVLRLIRTICVISHHTTKHHAH